jgi:hypothetical protein
MIDKQIRTFVKINPVVASHPKMSGDTVFKYYKYIIKMRDLEKDRISYDIWVNDEHEMINKSTRDIVLSYVKNYQKKPHISRFKDDMINIERECKLKRIVK